MLTSISPLGERARHNRWSITVSWYVAASLAAAAGTGALLGLIGSAPGATLAVRAAVLAALAAAVSVVDALALPVLGLPVLGLRVPGLRVPGPRRQVDEDWLNRYRGWVYGAGFGAQLGAGVATIVTTATVWLYLAAALLSGSWLLGGVVGATFGLVRALPLISAGRVTSFAQMQRRHAALVRMAPASARITVALAGLAAVGLGVVAAGAS